MYIIGYVTIVLLTVLSSGLHALPVTPSVTAPPARRTPSLQLVDPGAFEALGLTIKSEVDSQVSILTSELKRAIDATSSSINSRVRSINLRKAPEPVTSHGGLKTLLTRGNPFSRLASPTKIHFNSISLCIATDQTALPTALAPITSLAAGPSLLPSASRPQAGPTPIFHSSSSISGKKSGHDSGKAMPGSGGQDGGSASSSLSTVAESTPTNTAAGAGTSSDAGSDPGDVGINNPIANNAGDGVAAGLGIASSVTSTIIGAFRRLKRQIFENTAVSITTERGFDRPMKRRDDGCAVTSVNGLPLMRDIVDKLVLQMSPEQALAQHLIGRNESEALMARQGYLLVLLGGL